MIAIDVGACQGRFIDKFPEYKIHAFEPHPDLANKLKQKYPNAVINHAACWSYTGWEKMYLHKNGLLEGSSLITRKTNLSQDYISIPTINLGIYLQQFDEVEVLKIDAEGAEYVILESILDNYDPAKIKRYLVEDHERKINDLSWKYHKEEVLAKMSGIEIENWK